MFERTSIITSHSKELRKRLTLTNLAAGDLLVGRYAVISFLGRGASGTVVLCKDNLLGGLNVALKLVPDRIRRKAVDAARFSREVRAGFQVRHSNLVCFYDLVRQDGLLGYTMEAVSGKTLQKLIDEGKNFDQAAFVTMFMQMTKGLAALHGYGILHRDLKPANILLSDQGQLKITDYGLAHFFDAPESLRVNIETQAQVVLAKRLTLKGNIVGTPHYLSPEYVEFGTVDARHDLYALGVIAYEVLSKKLPFPGQTIVEQLCDRVARAPDPIRNHCADISVDLEYIVMKLLERDPALRFQTANELRDALQRLHMPLSMPIKAEAAEADNAAMPPLLSIPMRWLRNRWEDLKFAYDVGIGFLVEGREVGWIPNSPVGAVSRFFSGIAAAWDRASPQELLLTMLLVAALLGGTAKAVYSYASASIQSAAGLIRAPNAAADASKLPGSKARYFGPTRSKTLVVRDLTSIPTKTGVTVVTKPEAPALTRR